MLRSSIFVLALLGISINADHHHHHDNKCLFKFDNSNPVFKIDVHDNHSDYVLNEYNDILNKWDHKASGCNSYKVEYLNSYNEWDTKWNDCSMSELFYVSGKDVKLRKIQSQCKGFFEQPKQIKAHIRCNNVDTGCLPFKVENKYYQPPTTKAPYPTTPEPITKAPTTTPVECLPEHIGGQFPDKEKKIRIYARGCKKDNDCGDFNGHELVCEIYNKHESMCQCPSGKDCTKSAKYGKKAQYEQCASSSDCYGHGKGNKYNQYQEKLYCYGDKYHAQCSTASTNYNHMPKFS